MRIGIFDSGIGGLTVHRELALALPGHDLVYLGDTARVGALLRRHPRLATAPDGCGSPPIHHAARNGDTEIVRLLIEHGADVNAQTDCGQTVLYCAGGHGHLDTMQLLLDNGAG